jgi:hypothetical protein
MPSLSFSTRARPGGCAWSFVCGSAGLREHSDMEVSATHYADLARHAIQPVLDGAAPNGTKPEDCGPWATVVDGVFKGYASGGKDRARKVFNTLAAADQGIVKMMAGADQVRLRRTSGAACCRFIVSTCQHSHSTFSRPGCANTARPSPRQCRPRPILPGCWRYPSSLLRARGALASKRGRDGANRSTCIRSRACRRHPANRQYSRDDGTCLSDSSSRVRTPQSKHSRRLMGCSVS